MVFWESIGGLLHVLACVQLLAAPPRAPKARVRLRMHHTLPWASLSGMAARTLSACVALTALAGRQVAEAFVAPTQQRDTGAALRRSHCVMGMAKTTELVFAPNGGVNDDFNNEQELDYMEWLCRKFRRKGQFEAAEQLEADIVRRQTYDVRAVTRLNEVFYQAFTKQDTKVMSELWLREPEVSCIHPGVAEVVVGYDRVMRVWKDILAPKRSWIRITPEDCHVVVRGNTGFAYCYERVVSEATGTSMEQRLFATNVFVRRQGMWYIVHHHATLLKPSGAEKGGNNQPNAQLAQQLQSLAGLGLNGAKIVNLGGLKGGAAGSGASMGGSSSSLDDLAAQLGAIERQLANNKKPRFRMLKGGKYQGLSNDDGDDEDDDDVDMVVQRDKALTRKTVRAIQQLFSDGRITLEQKRRLLNEIIQHANDDVPSMVEIAYELLLRNDDEEDGDASGKAGSKGRGGGREDSILEEFADAIITILED